MFNNKKVPTGTLLAAGIAAYAYYKYSKMSEEEKSSMVSNVKDQAQKLYDQYLPEEVKNIFQKKTATRPETAESHFGDGNGYTG